MTKNTTASLIGLIAAMSIGCRQEVLCSELGSCGGTPVGDWLLLPGYPSCSEDLYTPPPDTRLSMTDIFPSRSPPPEPALFDWCLLLVTGPGTNIQIKPPRFYYESGAIGSATIRYECDPGQDPARCRSGHFSAGLTFTGTFSLDFPAYCMRAFGGMDGKPAIDPTMPDAPPMGPDVDVCKQLQAPLRHSGEGEGSYKNTTCDSNPADPGGCLCKFDVTETGGPSGTWQLADDHTIVHLPGTNFPEKATFCNKGDSLELTGANGAYLYDKRALRTLKLARMAPQP